MTIRPAPLLGRSEDTGRSGWDHRWRAVVTVVVGPVLAGYALVAAVLVLLVWAAGGAEVAVAGTARAAAAAWLTAHQVPLVVDGAPLGVLPLLPTAVLAALTARTVRRAAHRGGLTTPYDGARLVGACAAAHGWAGLLAAWAVAAGPAPVVTTSLPGAALGCAAVAAGSAAWGVAAPCGWLPVARRRLPAWAGRSLAAGALGLVMLLTAGLAVVLVGLVSSAGAVADAVGGFGPAWGAGAGLVLLSLAYLPNAAVAAASWLAGPGVALGAVVVTPFGGGPAGPLPAVPLLAALPEGPAASWLPAVVVVPLLVGVVVGRRCVAAAPDREGRLQAVAAAAAVLAVGCFGLAVLVGGRLGVGALDPVRVPAGWFAVAVAAWTFLPGVVAMRFGTPAMSGSAGDSATDEAQPTPSDRAAAPSDA